MVGQVHSLVWDYTRVERFMNMKSYLILFSLLILVVSSFTIHESFADKSGIYQLQCTDGTFEIPYQISNGIITNMDSTSNRDLKISIKEATNGNITVNIPRSFVDAKIGDEDDSFFVLVNKNEIYWKDQIEVKNPTTRILTIPFPESDVTIDVIAGGIPERPRTRNCSAEEIGWEYYWIGGNFATGTGSCPPISYEKKLQQVPLIFSGTVVSKEYLESGRLEITFQINEVFKGPPIAKITLPTFEDKEGGIEFNEEVDYIVIAEYFSGRLAIDPICGSSVNLSSNPQFINEIRMRTQNLGFSNWTQLDKITVYTKIALQQFFGKHPPPPLKQVNRFEIQSNNVICKVDLELIFKSTDGSPACAKPDTIGKLIEREWGIVSTFCLDKDGNHRDDLVLIPIKEVFKIGEHVKADIINCGSGSYWFPGTDYSMKIESMDGSIIEGACAAGEGEQNILPYRSIPWQAPWGSPPCDHSKITEGEYWIYLGGTDSKGKYKIKYEKP